MITPTCQVCGGPLNLDDGNSVETLVRRGRGSEDWDEDDSWEWNQELRFRFCGEEHLRSWMSAFSLPAYEPPTEKEGKMSSLKAVGEALLPLAFCGFLLVVLTGSVGSSCGLFADWAAILREEIAAIPGASL